MNFGQIWRVPYLLLTCWRYNWWRQPELQRRIPFSILTTMLPSVALRAWYLYMLFAKWMNETCSDQVFPLYCSRQWDLPSVLSRTQRQHQPGRLLSIPGIPLQNTSEKVVTHGNLEFFYKNVFVNPTPSSVCLIIGREKECICVCVCVCSLLSKVVCKIQYCKKCVSFNASRLKSTTVCSVYVRGSIWI